MSNAIYLENLLKFKNRQLRFCIQTVTIEISKYRDGTPNIKQHSIIILKNNDNQKYIVHPLTDFILSNWKYKAYNTQRVHANNLVTFLNFIVFDNVTKAKISSLEDLDLHHASDFLNSLTLSKKSRVTVKSKIRTLTKFYQYLVKKHLLKNLSQDDFIFHPNSRQSSQQYIESPFQGVILPVAIRNRQAHMLPENYILPFLETVAKISNPILLGVYMQCFGGIRNGEIVNIRRSDISTIGAFAKHGLVVNLVKQQIRLNIKDSEGSNYVKKPRSQVVYAIRDWLSILYKNHLQNYLPMDESNALFVNRNGQAMTGSSYRYHFNKAKKEFLKQLRSSTNPIDRNNASKLETYEWSTHIGRGIFTNLLAEEAANPYDIALPRGDSSIESSIVYQSNTLRMKEKLEQRMDLLYKNYIPKITT